MKILIGGGTGFIGRHLISLLKGKGYYVKIISRKPGNGAVSWNQIEKSGFPEYYDAVVNLSGENLMNPFARWNKDFKSVLESSRINATKIISNCIDANHNKPRIWVSASAVGYYPPSTTKTYTEDSNGGSGDYFSELCKAWEEAAHVKDDNVRQAIVRIGIVLGRDGGTIKQLYLPFYFGLGGPIGSGQQWFPWVHVRDVAGIFAHAIENNHVTGVLNAVAPESITNKTFTKTFGKTMNRPTILPSPTFIFNVVYGRERAKIITQGQKVLPERTLQSGYHFEYPDILSASEEFSRQLDLSDFHL